MKLQKPENPNYSFTVVKVGNDIPLKGRDFIVHKNIFGNMVITSKDQFQANELALYIPPETQLSADFCKFNNLYEIVTDKETGKKVNYNYNQESKGYISYNKRRIRAIKLGGFESSGLLMPLTSICNLGIPKLNVEDITKLKEGDDFDGINDVILCQKYVAQARNSGTGNYTPVKKGSKLVDSQFNFHISTAHLGKNIHSIYPNDIIQISEKEHGCVSKDTIVETLEFGNLPIQEIVENELECRIKAFDIHTNEIVYVPIDEYYYKQNDGDWYEIELENGQKIEITGNNPVWMPELNCYRKAELLDVNDVLLID